MWDAVLNETLPSLLRGLRCHDIIVPFLSNILQDCNRVHQRVVARPLLTPPITAAGHTFDRFDGAHGRRHA